MEDQDKKSISDSSEWSKRPPTRPFLRNLDGNATWPEATDSAATHDADADQPTAGQEHSASDAAGADNTPTSEMPPAPDFKNTSVPAFPDEADPSRRGFFARCIRDMMAPVANLIERKVGPITSAFDADSGHDAAPMYSGTEYYDHYDRYATPDVILRPPGALPADDFEKTCSKCALCVQACPVKCITIDAEAKIGGGFPYILPALAPCVVCDELACMKACPSGALKLVEKARIRIGLAVVDGGSCLRSHGEDCRLCVEACPIGGSAIIVSQTSGRVLVKTNGCVGCGSCEHACPTDPAAITIRPISIDAFPNED